jgi:protein-S-isoprenylcysteine O-methyltransferase Ste14
MKTLFIAFRSLIYMAGFFALWGWAALSVRVFDPRLGIALPGWARAAGIVLMLPGAVLGFWCAGEFITRGRGTPAPFDAPRQFVAAGPYRFVRNPMYVGGVTFLVGFGLYARSISILILALVLLLVAHLFVVFYEEPTLKKHFGASYEAYCRDVHRWWFRPPKTSPSHGTQAI